MWCASCSAVGCYSQLFMFIIALFFFFLNELIPVLTSVGLHRKTSQNSVINKEIRTLKPVERLFFSWYSAASQWANKQKSWQRWCRTLGPLHPYRQERWRHCLVPLARLTWWALTCSPAQEDHNADDPPTCPHQHSAAIYQAKRAYKN